MMQEIRGDMKSPRSSMVHCMIVRNAAHMDGIELHLLLKNLNMVASGTHQQEA
jgi:hypothetical protein